MRRYIFLTYIMLLQAVSLFSQSPLVFKRITVDNGLPQNIVMDIFQDKKGLIWIGTFGGLSKFNGIGFNTYKNDPVDLHSLSNNRINKVAEDHVGQIWIGTTNGINRYDPNTDRFERYSIKNSKARYAVFDIVIDKNGKVWAGSEYGLLCYDPKHHTSGSFERVNGINTKIQTLFIDYDQYLWIANEQQLKIYDLVTGKFVSTPSFLQSQPGILNSVVQNVIRDHSGKFWIGTETGGLFCYSPNTKEWVNYNRNNGLLSNAVRALIETKDHLIYVGTKNGLNVINPLTRQISTYRPDPTDPNSLSSASVHCITQDGEGNIWLGTYNGGVSVLYHQFDNFHHFGIQLGHTSGLSYGIVNSIFQDRDQSFWVGTDDGGLNHVDPYLNKNKVFYIEDNKRKELTGCNVKAIQPHSDLNKLWVGTGLGLRIFDKVTHQFTTTDLLDKPIQAGFVQNFTLLKDGKGLWAGTNYNGLYYIENDKVIQHYQGVHNATGGMGSPVVTALLRDGEYLWIGTKSAGLNRLNVKSRVMERYTLRSDKPGGLSNESVLSIYKDRHNRLWIGTEGGLNYLDVKTSRFYPVSKVPGLQNNSVYQILEDEKSRLWVSTNTGLFSLYFKSGTLFQIDNMITSHYTVEDGLQSNQFTAGAGVNSQSRQLIFGGINGITAFYPDKVTINPVKPAIILTDFLIFNKAVAFGITNSPLAKPIDETEEITLPYDQAFFSIKFAALNYINPGKNQFAFKLDGLAENGWRYSNSPIATYTNLEPGVYFFKVKAANNDGVWNDTPRVLKINILPPWYKTWYAYMVYLSAILVALYFFNYYSGKTARLKAQLEFDSISHLKDQELAQKKLNFFVNISHEIKTPLTMIMAPVERLIKLSQGDSRLQHQLSLMQRNGERLIRLINQLLDIRKFESGNMHLQAGQEDLISFLKEIALAFNGLAQSKNITLTLKVTEEELLVWFDRDKLEKVVYNLLSNAFKFTPVNGTITLYAERDSISGVDKQVWIGVIDNGCGIAPDDMDQLFRQFFHNETHYSNVQGTGLGLAFSKELIELHHGTISVESTPESGAERGYTHFKIGLLLGKDHFKENELVSTFKGSEAIINYRQTETFMRQKFSLRKTEILNAEEKGKLYLLIIEDNDDVLNFVRTGFEDDFVVYTATNGLDGWALAKEHMPDVIISDVMMPKMDGIELCRLLKSTVETSHIPVILLTARTPTIFKIEGLDTGADDYVTKPFTFSILEARVWNLIENRQKMRAKYQKEIMLEPSHITINDTDESFLRKVIAYIEEHIDDVNLSVENLNNETAMSRSSFTKKLKALTNQTGVEFIRTIRLKRAAQLLATGKFQVNEVVYQVGFEDINYFGKCFKKQFGYTPKTHSSQN